MERESLDFSLFEEVEESKPEPTQNPDLNVQEVLRTAQDIEDDSKGFDQINPFYIDEYGRVAKPSSMESYVVFDDIKKTIISIPIFIEPTKQEVSIGSMARKKLGLTLEGAQELFTPEGKWDCYAEKGEKGYITAKQAVKVFRNLAETGIVNWNI